MSLTVVAQETALRALARIRAEDKEAFTSIRRALAELADQPHPDQTAVWGGSGIYRLRLPGIRIVYEVDEDAATVYVINVAVTM
jgi:mRNA-degrading endonuclease RelE of RelBE toxin-antitoxin system